MNTLEIKLNEFCYILPGLDRRWALVDFGGKVLKALFGTATASDIHLLHGGLNELKFQNSEILVFSLSVYLREEVEYGSEDRH